MKIAVYYSLPLGGASRTMEEIIRKLKTNNEVVAFESPKENPKTKILNRLLVDCEALVLQKVKQKLLAQKIDSLDFDVVLVSHDKYLQAPWILRFLKTPTVFLCQEPTRAYFEKFLDIDPNLPWKNKVYERINRSIRKNLEIQNARHAKAIMANSQYSVESIFRAYGVISTPIHLGIDTKEYFPQKISKTNSVLVIGNNEPQKALPFAIEIISKIEKNIRPSLEIASPRQRNNEPIIQLAKERDVQINWHIGLNQKELCKVYNKSLITLAAAYLEPFGLSVIESLACATPVVAVNEAGFRETIINGKTGLLVERDSDKIAHAVSDLLKNRKLLDSMGRDGVKDVKSRFTWDQTVEKLEKLLHETAKK